MVLSLPEVAESAHMGHPDRSVMLGAGKPLLPRRIASPPLRLVTVRAVGTGFAELKSVMARERGG